VTASQTALGPERPLVRSVADLTEVRARTPQAVALAAAARSRRPLLGADGRLLIVAADHPARGALGVRDRGDAMASRSELLERLCTALERPGVDGVLGTPDILEDLLLLGRLEGKVVFGSMNRGGLQGASFELDDRFTAYDARAIAAMGYEGGKMLTRVDLDDPATVATLHDSARAVSELAELGLLAMVEPFMSRRVDGRVKNDLSPEAVIRSVHIAQGLGTTSAYTWMKLPVVADMARVMDATTLPTLLLGGDPSGHPDDTYAEWGRALELPSVRGLVVGRALLYPQDGDVGAAVDVAARLVHGAQS
jgi:DhnA family fructose-bisphosphate aldolase class Ia